jgi:hypothetical protein
VTVIMDDLVTKIYPLPFVADGDIDVISNEIAYVTTGSLLFPCIRWTVKELFGVEEMGLVTYVDQHIVPPMQARIRKSLTADSKMLLFGKQEFLPPGRKDLQAVTTDEYHQCIKDAQDLASLNLFCTYLSNLQSVHDKYLLEAEEDGDDTVAPILPARIPSDIVREKALVLVLNQCNLEINTSLQLQRDMVQYLYPNSKQPDKFIHFPIYGVEETTNEGMLLMGVKLNQLAGLLVESDRGWYTPGPNAKTRKLFLYEDGLLVVAHNKLHDTIYRQQSRLENERYVKTLFNAHESVLIQKGHFHQQMHQLGVVYTMFYGGFMQPLQVANGIKRVMGDPLKGKFKDHERFAVKLFKACRRFMLRRFVQSEFLDEMDSIRFHYDVSRLKYLLKQYADFRKSWTTSAHEPSQVVALFVKYMESYVRCKRAVKAQDGWLMEKESCIWLGAWKMCDKKTYLLLQCKYCETWYNDNVIHPVDWETMRLNNFCVNSSGNAISFDEANKNYNMYLKAAPATPYLQNAIDCSRHKMLAMRCAKEVWGSPVRRKNKIFSGTSEDSDVHVLESILGTAAVMSSHNHVQMDYNFFWKLIQPMKTVASDRYNKKMLVELTIHEEELRKRFSCQDKELDSDDEHDDCVSVTSDALVQESVCTNDCNDGIMYSGINDFDKMDGDMWNDLTDQQKIDDTAKGLKKLGNVKRKTYNKKTTMDSFSEDNHFLRTQIKKLQKKALEKQLEK